MVPFDEIYQKIFRLLESELPSFLTYHSPHHTAYVVEKAEYIAQQENVNQEDIFLIKIGALFHDIGFINQYKNHEEAGCVIAKDVLKAHNFTNHEVEEICGMIMATKIPQAPQTMNEKIVADADLEYLGTDLFKPVSQLLYQELHYLDPELDITAFHKIQIDFLCNHNYHTDYCIRNREELKQNYLQELKESI